MAAPDIIVPLANPGAGYTELKPEIDEAVARALASGWYILGAEGRAFEAEFATWLGSPHAIGCANGTDALALALRALDIGPGKTVATVSHTAVATVAAIEMTGATPLLLDIDPDLFTLDTAELAETLANPPPNLPPIAAIIPVHLYGQCADPSLLVPHLPGGIGIIEDCSQAHGATWQNQRLGTFGTLACFSLYPTKNLGALGDGGILAASTEPLAQRLSALRQYGWQTHYISNEPGVNSRLDELQAAILRARLPHLDRHNQARQRIAAIYDEALAGTPIQPPARRPGATHVFHQYVVKTKNRPELQFRLRQAGIATGIHYPAPVHRQPAYENRIALGPNACRTTDAIRSDILSLPMFPQMTDAQVNLVAETLRGL